MGLGAEAARSTLRLSLGWASTEAEVDRAATAIAAAALDQRRRGAGRRTAAAGSS
jgi:cysteine sulfinate desulfinase/cysteine desulfurase-like protein